MPLITDRRSNYNETRYI